VQTLIAIIADRLRALGQSVWTGRDLLSPSAGGTEILVDVGVPWSSPDMTRAPGLRALISPFLGFEFIDVAAATRCGVAVINGEVPENRESVAEAAIMFVLALLYRLHSAESALRTGSPAPLPNARMLKGKTVGLIGWGGISRALATRLSGWECTIQVATRAGSLPEGMILRSIDDLCAEADVVVVATSLDDSTRGLVNRKRLMSMKSSAVLVNVARGAIVDEAALVEVLRGRRIAGAALDVFQVEPLPGDHPLRELQNVVLTPHAIAHTRESMLAVVAGAVENVRTVLAGALPSSCKNPEIAQQWLAGR